MLWSQFSSLPSAFVKSLVPSRSSSNFKSNVLHLFYLLMNMPPYVNGESAKLFSSCCCIPLSCCWQRNLLIACQSKITSLFEYNSLFFSWYYKLSVLSSLLCYFQGCECATQCSQYSARLPSWKSFITFLFAALFSSNLLILSVLEPIR